MGTPIIVSRHPAAIAFVLRAAGLPETTPTITAATADDVRGRVVYGNLPLHLAALADKVIAIEFAGDPPRGQEYDLAAMDAAGARLRAYRVAVAETPATPESRVSEVVRTEVTRWKSDRQGPYAAAGCVWVRFDDGAEGGPYTLQSARVGALLSDLVVCDGGGNAIIAGSRDYGSR